MYPAGEPAGKEGRQESSLGKRRGMLPALGKGHVQQQHAASHRAFHL